MSTHHLFTRVSQTEILSQQMGGNRQNLAHSASNCNLRAADLSPNVQALPSSPCTQRRGVMVGRRGNGSWWIGTTITPMGRHDDNPDGMTQRWVPMGLGDDACHRRSKQRSEWPAPDCSGTAAGAIVEDEIIFKAVKMHGMHFYRMFSRQIVADLAATCFWCAIPARGPGARGRPCCRD